ncbi:MAG TPA: SWIM zinc finger family protein [Pseudonocardia sp.]
MGETSYQTDLYRQTCTCPAGQYGRPCKHLRALADQQTADEAKVANAQARWDREVQIQQAARAREIARSHFSATYPETD